MQSAIQGILQPWKIDTGYAIRVNSNLQYYHTGNSSLGVISVKITFLTIVQRYMIYVKADMQQSYRSICFHLHFVYTTTMDICGNMSLFQVEYT